MKFIRKGGRIIPIKEKGDSDKREPKKGYLNENHKRAIFADTMTGLAVGVMGGGFGKFFAKNKKTISTVAQGIGVGTTISNFTSSGSIEKNVVADSAGVVGKIAGTIAGVAGSRALLKVANNAMPTYRALIKARKVF